MTTKLRLSQIKLAGFKSFVDPTHIHLPGQIVGVVGPNGCGKSNVIDALRWVLGESKASALRGESMQDVIFNGSGKRRPVSRASVELVFDNSLGKAVGQWSSYVEISIKRVLQRNGDSSYFINTQKVRRKDITDIFLGTGLGARAYAIIEQGMISRIIEAKPEELRVFLEEAAGVSKYRDRRRDTSQRLNDTRDNLLRVADVLEELDRQLLHLDAQAGVARQYRELEAQRDTTRHLLWLVKKQEAQTQRNQHLQGIEKTRTELEAETARLREAEKRIEASRSLHQQLSDALNARQGELYAANAQVAQLEQQIRHVAAERQRIQAQIANTERQLAHQRQQREEAAGMLEHWRGEQQAAAESLAEEEMVAEQQAERLPQIEEAARAAQQHHYALQREQMQLQQHLQLADTQLVGLQRNIGQFEARRARLQQEQVGLSRPDLDALQQMQQEQADLEMLRAERQEGLSRLQEQLPHTEQLLNDARAALQQHERAASQTEARLHALQQLQRQLDSDRNMQGWLRQHGLEQLPRLWQSVRIKAGWEDALEAVLRERLNAFALSGRDELMGWTDAPPGKLALFALADPATTPAGPVIAAAGEFTPLLDYLECQDPRVTPALGEWLAGVYAAADLASAQARSAHLPPGVCFVTPQGHLVGSNSVLFHAPDSQLHGVLVRQAEIVRLEQQLDEQQQAVAVARQQFLDAEQQHRSVESLIPPLRNEVNTLQQRQHGLQMRALKLMQENERNAERAAVIERELKEAAELLEAEQLQRQAVLEQAATARAEIAAFHAQLQQAAQQAEQQDRAAREQRGRMQQAQHALQEARFHCRSCAEKIADLGRNLEQLAASVEQADQTLAALHEDFGGAADEQAQQDLQQALQARQLCEQVLSEARSRLEARQQEMRDVERDHLSSEQQINQLRDRLNSLALKEQEARLYFEQWAEQLRGVDELVLLPQLAAGSGKPAMLQAELNRLEAAIVQLGSVNLAALEELQAASERKQYLDAQASDLQEAMETLEEAIRRIDRESRELLMATYDQVNGHLAELFPVLFAGGEARLVLTGEEILDSGVQVMAQPPGKKNSTIHLLSGGEKALTAIALVFSLFQLNPAPFCLLDEVDAPLDDTNTERLCALIRRMSQQTQFVFISHNKIAMEMALQLVGVTMQEKGVSKIVSVDIEEALRMRENTK